jgi:hypothetical protein
MSVEQIEQSILSLSDLDRHRLLDWMHEHEDQLIGLDGIHPEVKAEVLRRREAAMAQPGNMENWTTVYPRMQERFNELRGQNPYSR